MLPSFCSKTAPPGERLIYEKLKDDPGAKGWIVLHSLNLANHVKNIQGEADFVIIIPSLGVIVLEVKSHKSVRVNEHGWWMGSEGFDERGPFKQASDAMFSILKFLGNLGFKTFGLPFVSAAAFTEISFPEKSPEWHQWQVLDRQSLTASSISSSCRVILQEARSLYSSKGLAWAAQDSLPDVATCDTLGKLLRPRFEILANPRNAIKSLEENLVRCTEQQFEFLDNAADNDRLLVTGLAGTGKTTLAVECVRREVENNPTSGVALFCFNRLLGHKLEAECNLISRNIKSGSFHQWLLSVTGIKPSQGDANDPEFWSKRLPELVLEQLVQALNGEGLINLLVLDEAQDLFCDPYLDILDLLLKGGLKNGRWLFLGDFDRQDLFANNALPLKKFRSERATQGLATFRLGVNCRNTVDISRAVTQLTHLNPGYSAVLREDTCNPPQIFYYSTSEEQFQLATTAIEQLLKLGFKNEDIVLLSPITDSIAQALEKSPQWKGRIKSFPSERTITHATIHSFKGLESKAVIITDITDITSSKGIDLFYVGMSRALHSLHVLAHSSAEKKLEASRK